MATLSSFPGAQWNFCLHGNTVDKLGVSNSLCRVETDMMRLRLIFSTFSSRMVFDTQEIKL